MKNLHSWYGILLAAGKGKRFDASGERNKLSQLLPSGITVAGASARHLQSVLPSTLVVISPESVALATLPELSACEITICHSAQNGLASSLVHALQQMPSDCAGWVIALGDMPFVKPESIVAIVEVLEAGADIVVPTYQGKRGNPVGFSRKYLPQLLALNGDQGARHLLKVLPVTEIALDDIGILQDIDTPQDLDVSTNRQSNALG